MVMKIKPFKTKKMNKKITLLLIEELKNPPVAPMEQLRREAAEFEKMMLERRSIKHGRNTENNQKCNKM